MDLAGRQTRRKGICRIQRDFWSFGAMFGNQETNTRIFFQFASAAQDWLYR